MTNLKKAPGQKPPKKKHLPKQDDEDEWKLEPELPDDMRMWGTFSDSLASFPKHDTKLRRSRFIRKDAVARMLRYLVSRTNTIDLASDPSSCRNCRKVVLSIKETIDKPCEDPPSSKEPVPSTEEDSISGTESPPHLFESDCTSCPYSALWPGKSACPCIRESLLDGIIPENSIFNPHHPAHQDHSAKTLPPSEPGSNSSQQDLHVKGRMPTSNDPPFPNSLSEENDIAYLSEEDGIAHPLTLGWNESRDVVLEANL